MTTMFWVEARRAGGSDWVRVSTPTTSRSRAVASADRMSRVDSELRTIALDRRLTQRDQLNLPTYRIAFGHVDVEAAKES